MILNVRAFTYGYTSEVADIEDFIVRSGTLEAICEHILDSFVRWNYNDSICIVVVTDTGLQFESLYIDSRLLNNKWIYYWSVDNEGLDDYLEANGYSKMLDVLVNKLTEIKNKEINKSEEERKNKRYKQYLKLKEEFGNK